MRNPLSPLMRTSAQKFPMAGELSDKIMQCFPDGSNPDENLKAIIAVVADILSNMFPTSIVARMKAADAICAQTKNMLKVHELVVTELTPYMRAAEKQGRPITQEEVKVAMTGIRERIEKRVEAEKQAKLTGENGGERIN